MEERKVTSSSQVFYAACLPQQARLSLEPLFKPEQFISEDKNDIIAAIKKYRGSRFKSFPVYEDALKFVLEENCDIETVTNDKHGLANGQAPRLSPAVEESPPFPSLDVPELNIFKRAIINKDLDTVKRFVWTNPRYLISNYFDSPTIIVQGARYNTVHLAIRNRCPDILNFVLDTINSLEFVQLMYVNSNQESLMEKRNHLLDLYLNSPDKVCFDTPLHMACKLGDVQCVKILVGYIPVLDTKKTNKFNKLPHQVVQDSSLQKQIHEMIESSVFITVGKSKLNLDKTIQKACQMGRKILESNLKNEKEIQISAIVGPMTPEKSQTVYNVFKSPKKLTPEQRSIRLKDPNRGLERVVFELSNEFNLPYCEYYSFIDDFANFCTEQDLQKLDDHLRSRHDELSLIDVFERLNFDDDDDDDDIPKPRDPPSVSGEDVFWDCIQEEDDDDDDVFVTASGTPTESVNPISNGGQSTRRKIYINGSNLSSIDYDVHDTIRMAIEKHFITPQTLQAKYPFVNQWFLDVKTDETII